MITALINHCFVNPVETLDRYTFIMWYNRMRFGTMDIERLEYTIAVSSKQVCFYDPLSHP